MRLKLARLAAAAALIAALTVGFVLWEHPMDEIATPVINRGYTDEKIVALTFDDGPHPVTTALLLNVLKSYGIHATFFVVGQKAEEYPELLRRIQRGGHQVACHTYSHDNLTCLSSHEANNELTYWERNVDGVVGHGSRFLRPPGGDFDQKTISMIRQRGYVLSLWSVNPGDWHMPPPHAIVNYIMGKVHPGAVILMHDDGLNTIRALPTVIKDLRHRGYSFVTLEEMQRRNTSASPQTPNPLSTPSRPEAKPEQPVNTSHTRSFR
jgi:peptidoglycan/xylan/chitin deacetylase (PgdA/CDA1 family)